MLVALMVALPTVQVLLFILMKPAAVIAHPSVRGETGFAIAVRQVRLGATKRTRGLGGPHADHVAGVVDGDGGRGIGLGSAGGPGGHTGGQGLGDPGDDEAHDEVEDAGHEQGLQDVKVHGPQAAGLLE